MPGQASLTSVNWNPETIGLLRQIYRLSADKVFRYSDEGKALIDEYGVTTDSDWDAYTFDFRTSSKVIVNLTLRRGYVSSLIQYLIKLVGNELPVDGPWYQRSFAYEWERYPTGRRDG